MLSGTIRRIANVAGVQAESTITRTATAGLPLDYPLPAAVAGTLSTRTSDTVGTVTAPGHGLTTADKANIFWGGAAPGCRHGVTVGTVSGDDVPFTVGAGDNLPAEDTVVYIAEQVIIDIADFDGDTMQMMAIVCDQRAHVVFEDVAHNAIGAKDLTANEDWSWAITTGVTNPLTGAPITHAHASCGAVTAGTLKVGILYTA